MYSAIVLSTLLYTAAEIRMVYKADGWRLQVYIKCHLCKTLNVKWWQYIPNKFIQKKSKLPGKYDILTQQNLKWVGHLNWLKDSRLPKQILYSQLREGSCKTDRPKFRHKEIIKRNLGVMNIYLDNWQYLSKGRKSGGKKISRISSLDMMDSK